MTDNNGALPLRGRATHERSRVAPSPPAVSVPNAAKHEARLAELLALEDNWNSYRALPISSECAERTWPFLKLLEMREMTPWITPENDGGLSLERGGKDDYSVELDPRGRVSLWFDDLSDDDALAILSFAALYMQKTSAIAMAPKAETACPAPVPQDCQARAVRHRPDTPSLQTPQGGDS